MELLAPFNLTPPQLMLAEALAAQTQPILLEEVYGATGLTQLEVKPWLTIGGEALVETIMVSGFH